MGLAIMLERLILGPCALENVHLKGSAFGDLAFCSNPEYIVLFLKAITLVFFVVPGYGLLLK